MRSLASKVERVPRLVIELDSLAGHFIRAAFALIVML